MCSCAGVCGHLLLVPVSSPVPARCLDLPGQHQLPLPGSFRALQHLPDTHWLSLSELWKDLAGQHQLAFPGSFRALQHLPDTCRLSLSELRKISLDNISFLYRILSELCSKTRVDWVCPSSESFSGQHQLLLPGYVRTLQHLPVTCRLGCPRSEGFSRRTEAEDCSIFLYSVWTTAAAFRRKRVKKRMISGLKL
jgi:hypothetical protein